MVVLFVLIAIVFYAALPLFLPGFIPTHDGEYHIIRFFEFEKMLKAGYMFPRWAPDLNSGYGIPLFNFFYPLPNYIGSAFHTVGWSLTDSFKLVLAMGYIGSGVFCFFWLKKLFSIKEATIGTMIFSFIPYWFVDIYVRGAIGEVLSIFFLMLFFACLENNRRLLSSFAVAGIIISHNILSLLFLPLLAIYALLRKKEYILNSILGIGMAAYFWLPALLERKFVVGLNTVNIFDYFPDLYQIVIPSWGTGFSGAGLTGNEMSPQIGVISIVVIFLSLFYVVRSPDKSIKQLVIFFLIAVLFSFFLMLSISYPIWKAVSVLFYLQYPWRLLSIFLPAVAFLAAFVASKIHRVHFQALLVVLAIIVSYPYARPTMYPPRSDEYYLTKREFTDGTSSLGNSFATQWSSWKKERSKDKIEIIDGIAQITEEKMKLIEYQFSILAKTASIVRVNTLYYPGWTVFVDTENIPIDFIKDGTITFFVPSGEHTVRVYFTETPLRLMANMISLVSLFWLVLSFILNKYAYSHRHNAHGKRT